MSDVGVDGGVTSKCATFSISLFELNDKAGSAQTIIPMSDTEALVALRGAPPRFFAVSSTGADPLQVDSPPFDPTSGIRRGSEMWITGYNSALYRGWPDSIVGLHLASDAPASEPVAFLAGSDVFEPITLFALGHPFVGKKLYRSDGRTWSTAWEPNPNQAAEDPEHAGIAWAPNGAFYVVPYGSRCRTHPRCILRVSSTTVTEETIPLRANDKASTVAYIEGIGVVAGTNHGLLLKRAEDGWQELAGSPIDLFDGRVIRKILPFRDGLLFVSDKWLGQYYPDRGFCDADRHDGGFRIVYQAAIVGETIFITGLSPLEGPTNVLVQTTL